MSKTNLFEIGLPFLIGTLFYRTASDVKDLLRIMVGFGCIYAFLIILEIAISPQLHSWVYGFHQHSWIQTKRFGGWRPTVFMEHGLAVGLFMCCVTLAAFGLARVGATALKVPTTVISPFLAIVAVLVKSLAAIVYLLAIFPVTLFFSPKSQLRVAVLLSVVVLSYPLLRITQVFPVEPIISVARGINEDRASSLQFRFENEDILLEKIRERIIFGWGSFNRWKIFEDGKDITTADGFWIIRFGEQGISGYAAAFGLLLLPIFIMARRLRGIIRKEDRILAGTLSIILAVYAVDLLPNGLFTTIPFLLAGALMGLSRGAVIEAARLATRVPDRSTSTMAARLPRTPPD